MKNKILILGLLILSPLTARGEPLVISTIEGSPVSEICSLILRDIYSQAGLELIIIPMPAARATIESTTGKIDGESHRVEAYGDIHRELLIIPQSYYSIDTHLFTQRGHPDRDKRVDELGDYIFAILKGVRQSQELTSGLPRVQVFESSEVMIRFLMLGRADFAILSRLHGMEIIEKLGAENLIPVEPPLVKTLLFHYVHQKNAHLIPLLERTIREMRLSGALEESIRRAEEEVTGKSW